MPLELNTQGVCCDAPVEVQPTLMYDFAGTRSLNPVVGAQPAQFTRDSRAFTFDPTGKLVRVPAGVPRFRLSLIHI